MNKVTSTKSAKDYADASGPDYTDKNFSSVAIYPCDPCASVRSVWGVAVGFPGRMQC
jgi:hypothetical protein